MFNVPYHDGSSTVTATRKSKTPSADLLDGATRLHATTAREGLTAVDLRQLLDGAGEEHQRALGFLLGTEPSASRKPVREVLEILEERLGGPDLGAADLLSPLERHAKKTADAVGLIAGLGSAYIVIGGLIEGDSLLLGHAGGLLGLALFAVVLGLLGLFEALHTSATMLKLADVDALADRYPRAAALHRHFRTDRGLARFLAGRQMVVIFTVFICSPLSSFPELTHWPLTAQALPGVMRPVITIGLPGALFVLWFGQLVPQFLATRHAVRLMNTRVVSAAFRAAYALESSGLARPGFWLTRWGDGAETIPSSPNRRWKEAAIELTGYGAVAQIREWTITAGGAELHALSTTRIYRPARSITDGALLVPNAPARFTLDARAEREGEKLGLAPTRHDEQTLPTGDRRFHKPLVCTVGSFRSGDTLHVSLDADWTADPSRDLIYVERPMRFVVIRVQPHRAPSAMSVAVLRMYTVGDGLGDLTETAPPRKIEPVRGDDGLPVLAHVIHFPPPGSLYSFDWEVDFDD